MAGGGDFISCIRLTAGTAGMCSVTGCGASGRSDGAGISGGVGICYRILDFLKATAGAFIEIAAIRSTFGGYRINKYIGMIKRSRCIRHTTIKITRG